MKRIYIVVILLVAMLVAAMVALRWSCKEREILEANFEVVDARGERLCDSLEASRLSVARLRLTVGELEEYRARDAEAIRDLGVRLRRAESLSRVESVVTVDTVVQHIDTLSVVADSLFVPLLSDTLYIFGWRDDWVSLDITSRPSESHVEITSRDTLFQVVHRVPYKWWIFSWGTKAIRQEIRSSNPHTRLIYAEYIEIER